jgi:DNA-binding response OmpR family regulator
VLVVDDEPSIRLLCRVNLELDGCVVLEAGALADARELLEAHDVDVVLLDVHVGPDDGRDLLRELRATRPETAVALLTGSSGAEVLAREDADALVAKPFNLDMLVSTVKRLAARTPEVDSST